jgi:uncharacterized membrane protein YkoI
MLRTLVIVLAGLGLTGLELPQPAAANEPGPVLQLAQADDVKPLAQVLETIAKQFPGRALDAELVKQGNPTYRVKWLGDDGKVREVTADAKNGKITDVR